jgi:hypothetical protein
MIKRMMGLVALVAGMGVLSAAACSSPAPEDSVPTADAAASGTADASKDVRVPEPPHPDTGASCETTAAAADIKAAIEDEKTGFGPYKSTLPSAGQCTEANITAFKAYLKTLSANATYDDVIRKLGEISADCAACTFKAQTGANWAPFVTLKTSSGGTGAFSNLAGCYESLGVGTTCAKALHLFDKCSLVTCAKCADDDLTQCKQDTNDSEGQCGKAFGPDLAAACKDDPKFKAAGAICEKQGEVVIVNLMTGACGPTSADAGGGG